MVAEYAPDGRRTIPPAVLCAAASQPGKSRKKLRATPFGKTTKSAEAAVPGSPIFGGWHLFAPGGPPALDAARQEEAWHDLQSAELDKLRVLKPSSDMHAILEKPFRAWEQAEADVVGLFRNGQR
jgi:hypothetical protein